MKILKTLLATALVATVATVAHAQSTVVFRITGSTAYRANVVNAISNIFVGNNFTMAFGSSSATGASDQIFSGTCALSGTNTPVVVVAHWSGSEGGIQAVSGLSSAVNHVSFLPLTTTMATGTAAGNNNTTNVTGGVLTGTAVNDSEIPDACMSDTYQASSQFLGVFHSGTYAALQESGNSPVGVNPFVFVATGGTGTTPSFGGATNITSQQFQQLYITGQLPLSFFTGNSADAGSTVFATGRDNDSGTRLTAFAETGFGALSIPIQFQPQTSGSAAITAPTVQGIAHLVAWPKETIDTIPLGTGQGGYASGGQLSGALGSTFNSANANKYLVGYLGVNDAKTALGASAINLAYNGVQLPYSGGTSGTYNYSVIENGAYTFWGYEHLYYRTATVGTPQQLVADAIALNLQSFTALLPLGSMNVSITGDGGTVAP